MTGVFPIMDLASCPVGNALLDALPDPSWRFVFPTQASANSWASAVARLDESAVAEKDRFLSWDRFLNLCRAKDEGETGPARADASLRLLWAHSALARGERGELPLKRLSPPGLSPTDALREQIALLPPDLPRLIRALARLPEKHPDRSGGLLEDYRILQADYSRFLERHGLEEESWIPPRLPPKGRWLGFCPEFFSGFDAWKNTLLSQNRLTLIEGKKLLSDIGFTAERFSSAQEEMDSAFARLAELMDQGAQPEDLSILVPRLDPLTQAYLRSFSRRFGLPVAFRTGKRLLDSPFGRILSSISTAEADGWSLSSLRALLSPGAFSWKEAFAAAALLRFGKKHSMPELSMDPRGNPRLWEATLRLCSRDDQAPGEFFRKLGASARRISSARDFPALRRTLFEFRSGFLDESGLEPEAARTLERVFAELDALEAWEGRLGASMPDSPRLGIFLSALGSTSYAAQPDEAAVPVYPFRVGILLASRHSVVIDLSLNSTAEARRHLTRLPEELATYLGDEEEASWNEELFIRSLSGAETRYCHALRGWAGYSLPHPFLLSAGTRACEGRPAAPPPEDLESAAWREARPEALPARLTPRSKRAFLSGPGAGRRALGLVARSQAGASGLKALSPPRPRRLSHKGLHTFILCPMRWFLESLPDMADSSADPEPLAEGTLTHSLIGDMFRALAGADGRLAPGALQSAPSLLKQLYGKAVAGTIRSFGPALQPSLEATEPRIVDRLIRLVKAEGEFEAAGWEIGKFEANLAWDREDLGLVLEGRADRLAKGAGGRFALVDYKKNGTPSASQVRIGFDGTIGDFQLALYALMLSASGLEPGVALYWSVESGKPLYVFGGDAEKPDWQSFMPERDAVESLIRSTVAAMDEGRILQARPDESTCSSCGLKPICRAHFASEAR